MIFLTHILFDKEQLLLGKITKDQNISHDISDVLSAFLKSTISSH